MYKENKPLGRHMLLELYGCPVAVLNDENVIDEILTTVVDEVNATLVSKSFHHFSPYGVSGVVVIAESHITVHTWPEHNYAAVDVFTCDAKIDYDLVEKLLSEKFQSEKHVARTIARGEIVNPAINQS
ncbi:MAG: adenosylmethionine decarboxylase [Calditrichaeota bacterium]|nr:adenosylmethionine decarboxylase [Calditrichota bacterium]